MLDRLRETDREKDREKRALTNQPLDINEEYLALGGNRHPGHPHYVGSTGV